MSSFANAIKQLNMRVESENSLKEPVFVIMPANHWVNQAKLRPIPKQLFSEFWHEGELCILFADSNQGKSILAVQIGNSISKGIPIPGFHLESVRQKVLYCDFELSDKQFEARYSTNFENHYAFDDWFLRGEINSDGNADNIEEKICNELDETIIKYGATVLIIDNLTYLRNDTEKARDALPLMKQLKAIKKKHNLSILCLAHTPKRDASKPITRNDLQGSKMLINFCDSSFAIGESQRDKSVRYLKQIKARNTEIIYDSENVILCQISKRNNFLGFDFVSFGDEREHLRTLSDFDKDNRIQEVLNFKQQGMSNVQIAAHFGVSETAIRKWLKKAKNDLEPIEPLEPGTRGSNGSSLLSQSEECPF